MSGRRPIPFADAQKSDLLRLCVMKCLNLGTHADMHLPKPDGPSEGGGRGVELTRQLPYMVQWPDAPLLKATLTSCCHIHHIDQQQARS